MKTVYDKTTGKVLYSIGEAEETEKLGVTDVICSEKYIDTHFDAKSQKYYEGAPQDKIEQSIAEKAEAIKCEYEALINEFAAIEVQKAYFRTDYETPQEVKDKYEQLRNECNAKIQALTGATETMK